MGPEWMGSKEAWFLAVNAVVAAIAFLSRARPAASPRARRGGSVTRRALSTAVLMMQRLRSFNILSSKPSARPSIPFIHPDDDAGAGVATFQQDTQQEPVGPSPTSKRSPPPKPSRPLIVLPSPRHATEAEDDEEDEGDPNAMSMDEVYALIVAAQKRRPADHQFQLEREEEEEDASRSSEVANIKAAEERSCSSSSRGWSKEEELRQRRLDSIFNYTQMLKQRAQAGAVRGRR